MKNVTPSEEIYGSLQEAYDFFNKRLFEGRLPQCIVTLQRKAKSLGYFSPDRFSAACLTEQEARNHPLAHEIALNPSYFHERPTRQTLSTLVHEMTHLEHQAFGKPPKRGYHNVAWGELMDRVGLTPSHNGQPDGRRTGVHMSHVIVDGGPFALAYDELRRTGFLFRWGDVDKDKEAAKKKAASKTKYTCPGCGVKAWAKPKTELTCGKCEEEMLP